MSLFPQSFQGAWAYFDDHRLPTRWAEAQIVVNDAVLIQPPYTVDSIKAPAGKEQSVAMVRKIMEQFFQRKKAAGNRASVATPIAPRKGG